MCAFFRISTKEVITEVINNQIFVFVFSFNIIGTKLISRENVCDEL